MNIIELIEQKRDGGRLGEDAIAWTIDRYTADEIPDYQMAALLMAVFLQGLDAEELAAWTTAMIQSGDILDLSHIDAPKVDKHSTGGVGDKVSIPLAPMVAACGVAIPMVSGRGLGHTGGTLDKLESIPGFTVRLDTERFTKILVDHGLVMAGQSATLAPADQRIYALRDVTGTVPSIPLISSSIMSKKLAEGLDALVLDVKVGSGAFMKSEQEARELAETMVGVGRAHDTEVVAILTNMDQPLGSEVGNANEVRESIDLLNGGGPTDLREIVFRIGEEMLALGGIAADRDEARRALDDAVASGDALEKLAEVVEAQGGDPDIVENPDRLPRAPNQHEVPAPRDGVVVRCDALTVGRAAVRLGAGRDRKEDDVDHAVGITIHAKVGQELAAGDPLATVGWRDETRLAEALDLLERAWVIGDEGVSQAPLVIGEVR